MSYLHTCTFSGDREDALIDYLYGERGSPTALAFADHLAACQACRAEVGELGEVRHALDEWSPPEPFRALTLELPGPQRLVDFPRRTPASAFTAARNESDALSSHRPLPVWARAAAAVACVGIGLGAANLRVSYGPEGVSMQTGWMRSSPQPDSSVRPVIRPAVDPRADGGGPWRADITALEAQLRSEMQALAPPTTPTSDTEILLQKMKTLIAQSEQRQQRELALRLGDLRNDVHAQRLADLSRIDRSIGVVQSSTGMEVLRQREMLNTLAVRVSQR